MASVHTVQVRGVLNITLYIQFTVRRVLNIARILVVKGVRSR